MKFQANTFSRTGDMNLHANLNQRCYADADADADARVSSIALLILRIVELIRVGRNGRDYARPEVTRQEKLDDTGRDGTISD